MDSVTTALESYGAALGISGQIVRSGKTLGVMVRVKSGRLRFESASSGNLLASGPINVSTTERFVESFWGWNKCSA